MADISVVMAVYQVACQAHLDAAICSILYQTFANLELIICSDGADSETYLTIQQWSQRDQRVIVTKNDCNLGAGVSRNRAAQLGSGKYIAIMDADDISSPDRLGRQYVFLESNPQYAFVGARGAYFYEKPGDRKDGYWYVGRPEPKDFLMTLPFVHASILFRREVFEAVAGYRGLRRVMRAEDYDLLFRIYERGYRGANLPEILYYIRMDEAAFRRRKYRYRFSECAVKLEGFFRLGLMPKGLVYGLKPLVVGLIPRSILNHMKEMYYAKWTPERTE